jgi:DNA-binding MarR family transcriptional regulator
MVSVGELFRLSRILRAVAVEAAAEPGEMMPSAGLVSVCDDLSRHEATTVGEIADRTDLAQSLVSKVVSELREAGVVEITPDGSDRRRSLVRFTQSARAELFVARGRRSIEEALARQFPQARLERVECGLEVLIGELMKGAE